MAHAELTELAAGEAIKSPRHRSLGPYLESFLAGVVARYVLRQPLIWSDELASILFLWLAMGGGGGVSPVRAHAHDRGRGAKPMTRAYLDVVATCAALAFLLLIVWPSWQYAYEESFITTPALQVQNIWRAAALPVGI
jgi:TRAP-type C4-dicarboxylate transport system permease small subunit